MRAPAVKSTRSVFVPALIVAFRPIRDDESTPPPECAPAATLRGSSAIVLFGHGGDRRPAPDAQVLKS